MPASLDEYFVTIGEHAKDPSCSSVALRNKLRDIAVTKDGSKHNKSDGNLLFPPSIIKTFLTKGNVQSVLGCNCRICQKPPGGRDVLSEQSLIDILTQKRGLDADETRRKFCVLLFMGAGFTARHVCSFDNRGLQIADQSPILQNNLFGPLQDRGLFNDLTRSEDLTKRFISIFREARRVFNTPILHVGDFGKILVDVNLPFLQEKPLFEEADRHGRAQLYNFVIHHEFQGSLPVRCIFTVSWIDFAHRHHRQHSYARS